MSENTNRKLAAILAADIVSYSRLIAEDEDGTIRAYRALRKTVLDPIIEQYDGRIANTAGDSLLLEFRSAVEAVKCANDIQNSVASYNAASETGREITFRIGINVGDVIAEGDDILGDGVNIAARLEALADPGGILVSKAVADYANGKVGVELQPLGPQRLKNIESPVEVYRVGAGSAVPKQRRNPLILATTPLVLSLALILVLGAGLVWWITRLDPAQADTPRIAVLALDDLSAGEDKGWLSDGIAEGVITELASYREFLVIARHSSFSFRNKPTDITDIAAQLNADYIVEGSKQKSGNKLRVTVQLINGHDGTHIWAHEFDADIGKLFDVQSQIAQSIATQIGVELTTKPPSSGGLAKVSALHFYLQGREAQRKRNPESRRRSVELYEKAIEADPDAPFGYAAMATAIYMDLIMRWVYPDVPRDELLRRGIGYAERAIEADPTYYESHIARGDLHLSAGEHEDAVIRYQMAVELNPSSSEALAVASDSLIFLNRADEAIESMERAMDINPITPGWYYNNLSRAYWSVGRCAEGLQTIKRRLRFRESDYRALIVNLVCVGKIEEARKAGKKLLELDPDFTVNGHGDRIRKMFNNPEYLERWLNGLRPAGLPEG